MKIEYTKFTPNEFKVKMEKYQESLNKLFEKSNTLENDILNRINRIK